jgi:hypothetical protein
MEPVLTSWNWFYPDETGLNLLIPLEKGLSGTGLEPVNTVENLLESDGTSRKRF